MRTRMSGGVGAGRGNPPGDPIETQVSISMGFLLNARGACCRANSIRIQTEAHARCPLQRAQQGVLFCQPYAAIGDGICGAENLL